MHTRIACSGCSSRSALAMHPPRPPLATGAVSQQHGMPVRPSAAASWLDRKILLRPPCLRCAWSCRTDSCSCPPSPLRALSLVALPPRVLVRPASCENDDQSPAPHDQRRGFRNAFVGLGQERLVHAACPLELGSPHLSSDFLNAHVVAAESIPIGKLNAESQRRRRRPWCVRW